MTCYRDPQLQVSKNDSNIHNFNRNYIIINPRKLMVISHAFFLKKSGKKAKTAIDVD